MCYAATGDNNMTGTKPLIICDVIGSTVILALLLLGAWSGAVHYPETSKKFTELESNYEHLRTSLQSTNNAIRRKTAELAMLQEDIRVRGSLPNRSPVEDDLKRIVRMARNNNMNLIRVAPSTEKDYPEVTELKYTVETKSRFEDLIGFLKDFEDAEFWADVTSLKIGSQKNRRDEENQRQTNEIGVSLFATRDTS